MSEQNPELGISIRMIRLFDAEKDREESLKRDCEEIRALYLLRMPCSETKQ